MGITRPTGEYASQMLEPGGWPEANEDILYDRAQEYNRVLRKVTDVMDACRHQQVEVFEGGVWSGGAANAANGALGANLNQMSTLQDYLATVITWHRHVAGLIVQAKSEIGNNVDDAQREINILENDPELDADARTAAINALVRATHQANASLVAETAEQVLASKTWKPPKNALEELLRQVTPPTPDIPTLIVPAPDSTTPVIPTPTPFQPTPANPYTPVTPGAPVTPVRPTPVTPVNPTPVTPVTPGAPVTPVRPGGPVAPVSPVGPGAPARPVTPVTPGGPVGPPTPSKPTPDKPGGPVEPVTPVGPVAPTPGEVTPAPAPPQPAPGPAPTPAGPPAPDRPSTPGDAGTPSTPTAPGTEPAHVKPAAATQAPAAPAAGGPSAPAPGDDAAAPVAPAAAGGIPAAARAASAGPGGAGGSAGASPSAGQAAASGAASRAASGRAPLGPGGRGPATPGPRAASARTAPPARRAPPPEPGDTEKERKESADAVTPSPSVPVSAARAARDAVAAAARRGGKDDPLRLARRIAAALNAPDVGGEGDYGFYWITAVTTDGEIVVANSYGLAYIPEEVQLPDKVYMASADHALPADEKARSATYPILAVQGWATYHDLTLRAVIGTAEQLANSDPGAAKIVLEPDDIPDSGRMTGRSRLQVVDPSAAAQLANTDDRHLIDLLPPAPVAENPPDDERHMLWFELMKPMTSTATGREVAHLRAFHAFAAHSQELALHQAHSAADPQAQRGAVADWLYWRHVAGLLDSALAGSSS
ncbi:secretion protein EspK [Mycobacterium shinjukuense]|uniref:secretion protein EspK n=1 Tax=Mycobacterium shinjukuense TaxID=398694 RepID=UPI0011531B57|nr:secretion protein EspK [Mycobacterium shinjukuense]